MYARAVQLAVLVAAYVAHCAVADDSKGDREAAIRTYQQLANTRKGLTALKRVVEDIDADLATQQKRTCYIGGGLSHHCDAQLIDQKMNLHDWLLSGDSPGKKRSAPRISKQELESRLEGLERKRNGLNVLRKILTEMDADVVHEQKRACQFNLGGHCATESAASLADQWHYLNSPLSPGRKRRDTRLYKKLVSGQLLH